jgi:hypothetical protein
VVILLNYQATKVQNIYKSQATKNNSKPFLELLLLMITGTSRRLAPRGVFDLKSLISITVGQRPTDKKNPQPLPVRQDFNY